MMRRVLTATALVVAAHALAAQGAQRALPDTERAFAAGDPDSLVTPVLMELRLGELASATVQAYRVRRSEEHTSELQSHARISYAVFCLKKKKKNT